jgi:hypothetical protein
VVGGALAAYGWALEALGVAALLINVWLLSGKLERLDAEA